MTINLAELLKNETAVHVQTDSACIDRGRYGATRTPITILLDRSGSMKNNDKIGQLNRGLPRMLEALRSDRRACNSCDLAAVAVSSKVEQLLPYTPLPECPGLPELEADGLTLLMAGVRQSVAMIRQQLDFYRSNRIPFHCPMLWVLTDGKSEGEDDALVGQVIEETAAMVQDGSLKVFAIAIGEDADRSTLRALANGAEPLPLREDEMLQALRAISDSVISVSHDVDYLLHAPSPTNCF